jgi:hypothetical protein
MRKIKEIQELDCEANTINYYDINDQLLFEIKINN